MLAERFSQQLSHNLMRIFYFGVFLRITDFCLGVFNLVIEFVARQASNQNDSAFIDTQICTLFMLWHEFLETVMWQFVLESFPTSVALCFWSGAGQASQVPLLKRKSSFDVATGVHPG